MKISFLILIIFLSASCRQKTPIELEDESVKSGIQDYGLPDSFYFGMAEKEVEWRCIKLVDQKKYERQSDGSVSKSMYTDSYTIKYNLEFQYDFSDNLFRIIYKTTDVWLQNNKTTKLQYNKDIFNSLQKEFSDKYMQCGSQPMSKYYWLKGNKRIDFIDTFNKVYIVFSDIPSERKIKIDIDNKEKERRERKRDMSNEDRVAEAMVREYHIAEREGSRMQMLTQAGLCSAAFLQAENEEAYKYWKHIEDSLSHSLGIPTYR